jgi:hypothetical protein
VPDRLLYLPGVPTRQALKEEETTVTKFQPGDHVTVREDSTALTELPGLRGLVGSVIVLNDAHANWEVWVEFEFYDECGFLEHELEAVTGE